MTPLDLAILIAKSSEIHRDPKTGLWTCDGTVPPTDLTNAQYESGMSVLRYKEKVALGAGR